MTPSPAAPATTTAPPAPSWRHAVARAVHPSAGLGNGGSLGLGDGLGIGDDDVLASIAAGLAAVAVPGEAEGAEPVTTLLLASEAYEAWLMVWPAGSAIEAHDHGGASGAISLVDGELLETVMEAGGVRVQRIAAGDTVGFGARRYHRLANVSARSATSVHVFSPPSVRP